MQAPDKAASPPARPALSGTPPTPAAVLVPLYRLDPHDDRAAPPAASLCDRLGVVLTRRPLAMRLHAGEVSFPGGRHDEGDADLLATALREAFEEIGLEPAGSRLICELPAVHIPATGFEVKPFVALVEGERRWRPSPREVDAVLELPLAEIRAAPATAHIERVGRTVEGFQVGDDLIWGATARILRELFALLDATPSLLARRSESAG